MSASLRIALIGAGDNTRKRHIPGLRAIPGVEIVAVCNRREESTKAVAKEFGIPQAYSRWQDVIELDRIDAIVIGAWPYLHRPVTLAALEAGKHVLTEARMSLNAAEAREMLAASQAHPKLVAQIVPSPYGLAGDRVMRELIDAGYLGDLREYHVHAQLGNLADENAPLTWRQDALISGYNMLSLGILHETLLRWLPSPTRVLAQACAFIPQRIDPSSGIHREVETPDSVQVLTILSNGARGIYQFSGVVPFGAGMGVRLYGSKGTLHYDIAADRIFGTQSAGPLQEIPIPADKKQVWRVEEDFVRSIREGTPVTLTNFATGVAYMEFTEAVARSALSGAAVELPLGEGEQ
jgi:predicted dehydrogenase